MNRTELRATARQAWAVRLCRRFGREDMRRRFWTLANAIRLQPALDDTRLAAAYRAVLEANPALRWSFCERNGEIGARVLPIEAFGVDRIDATGWTPAETQAAASAIAYGLDDPESGPLVALTHYRERDASVLLLRFSHVIVDGTAVLLTIHQLIAAYLLGRIPNASSTRNFADFADWQRAFVASDAGVRQFDYWTHKLAGLPPPLPLPYDRPYNERYTDGRFLSRVIDPDTARAARALARSTGEPLFRILWAGFNIALTAMTDVDDAPIICSIANRTRPAFRETIGWLANAVSLRCEIGPDDSMRAYCRRVSAMIDEALANQDYPRNLIEDSLRAEFPDLPSALDQIAFAVSMPLWEDELGVNPLLAQASGRWGEFVFEMAPLDLQECPRDLTATVLDVPGLEDEPTMSLSLNYRADVFDAATIARVGALYERSLALMTEGSDPQVAVVLARLREEFADLRPGRHGR